MKKSKIEISEEQIRVIKTGLCPSLSGASKLTFEIGTGPASEIHIRITKNSGTGYFNDDWVGLDRVHGVLEKNGVNPITSFTLGPLFKGKSANSAGFLLAALRHLGLVEAIAGKKRCYERADARAFFAEVQGLAGSQKPTTAKKAASKPRPARR